ncbi:MAG: metal-sensing transcriptional repressor [Clostridia bacterium]|nr:metal-sensing transcriptional repressor [Clostridia bacterium]
MPTDPSCPNCTKTTVRSPEERRALLNRLSRIEGQIRGLRGMIERDCYCVDILTQSSAAGAALSAFNRELLERHLRACVANGLREGDDSVIDELVVLIQKLGK